MYSIYCLTNTINNKLYIGLSKRPKRRWTEHKYQARKDPKTPIHFAINKYGKDSFQLTILEVCDTLELANEAEIRWIDKLNSKSPVGYNLADGGFVKKISEETRKKMSEAHKGMKKPWAKNNKNYLLAIEANKGNSYRLGAKNSPSHIQAIKKANSKLSFEIAEKIRLDKKETGLSNRKLALKYNVCPETINRIINDKIHTK